MTVHDVARALPGIEELRDHYRALAALDAEHERRRTLGREWRLLRREWRLLRREWRLLRRE